MRQAVAAMRTDLRHSGFMAVDCRVALLAGVLAGLLALPARPWGQEPPETASPAGILPQQEELYYRAEWRLVHAGNVRLSWSHAGENGGWRAQLRLQSAGLVSRLYRVDNEYVVLMDAGLCAASSTLRAHEGRKRREVSVRFDGAGGKASYVERDPVRDVVVATHEVD
ncbi:MAG: DUF3108 domain-containing protein, partial [Bryobacteraceae bacterium]|nr:DUF3108 domain-containing protein [Bryobacteraceae bacterium]